MIANPTELQRTREQLTNLEGALSDLHTNIFPVNPQRYRHMAESYVAEIEMLRNRIDDYIGLNAARPVAARRRLPARRPPRRKRGKKSSGRA